MKLFTAKWCNYCQPVKKMVLDNELNVQIVDIDENPELAVEAGVSQIPALEVNGELLLESLEIMRYLETI